MPEMYRYQVGGMFNPERTKPWPEGPHLWMDEDGIRFAVFLTRPTREEVTDIQFGKVRFAWTEQPPNGFLLFKFGTSPWGDSSFNPQRLPRPFGLRPTERGTHRQVVIFLVHADTGRIAAMRMLTWPAYFFNTVVESVLRLNSRPYSETEATAAQARFYITHPDGPSLGRLARTLKPEAVCMGGQVEDQPQLH